MNKKVESDFVENIIKNVKTPWEPLVKHNSEPNVEASTQTSDKAQEDTTKPITNIHMNDLLV